MRVNETTLMFEDLSEDDVDSLVALCDRMVLVGEIPPGWNHPLLKAWLEVCCPDERRALLMISTVFPGRAALSVCHWYRSREA